MLIKDTWKLQQQQKNSIQIQLNVYYYTIILKMKNFLIEIFPKKDYFIFNRKKKFKKIKF